MDAYEADFGSGPKALKILKSIEPSSELFAEMCQERGIYPVIKICTEEGQTTASDEEIADCYRSILGARAAGGNL